MFGEVEGAGGADEDWPHSNQTTILAVAVLEDERKGMTNHGY